LLTGAIEKGNNMCNEKNILADISEKKNNNDKDKNS
jgi:hypothetical protein